MSTTTMKWNIIIHDIKSQYRKIFSTSIYPSPYITQTLDGVISLNDTDTNLMMWVFI